MKAIVIILVAMVLTACGQNSSDNSDKKQGVTASPAAVKSAKLDLNNLPATVTVMLELDPAVEDGYDAFGMFNRDGKDVTVGISSTVAKAAGINVDEEFIGKVKVTISGEHEVSRKLYPVYSISSIEKI